MNSVYKPPHKKSSPYRASEKQQTAKSYILAFTFFFKIQKKHLHVLRFISVDVCRNIGKIFSIET